jgi:hypothetical protein
VTAVAEAPLPYPGQEECLDQEECPNQEDSTTHEAVDSTPEPAPEATENDEAYDQDSLAPSEPKPQSTKSVVTTAASKPCPDELRDQHFDYTKLMRRHNRPNSLPPIRWYR